MLRPSPVVLGLSLLLTASSAVSQARTFVSGEGEEYRESVNANGTVLTSIGPVSRQPAEGEVEITGIERIYLGKDCDTFHELFGLGIWRWSNGGFVAEFPDFSVGFPRQELSVDYPDCMF